jgi:hypothetical protein
MEARLNSCLASMDNLEETLLNEKQKTLEYKYEIETFDLKYSRLKRKI